MTRTINPHRKDTSISILKTTKQKIDMLRAKDPNKNSNESDNSVLERILPIIMEEHPELVHDPRSTYDAVQ